MFLPAGPDDGPVRGPGQQRPADAARPGQYLHPRPGPAPADPGPARRPDLEGPGRPDVPALRVPARCLLVQLRALAGQVDLADPGGPGPDCRPVGVRAPGDGR